MKAAFACGLLLSLASLSAPAALAAKTQISLEQVAAKVKAADFTLQVNAEKVYQSKEAVQVARMNLLPRLNFWKIINIVGGWQNAIGAIEDLVPFLVPNNWFRAKEQALFHEAELAAMQSLRANQIMTAKGIFLQAVMDERFLETIQANAEASKRVLEYTRLQEQFGQAPAGTSSSIEIRYLGLLEDVRALKKLTLDEKRSLGLMVGIPVQNEIELKKPAVVNLTSFRPINYAAIIGPILQRSPELEQYDYLYDAARYVKREVMFSVLGTSSLSRGVMGGVFDQYPTQSGLGFGMGPSLRIVRSQRDQIGIQKAAATEVLKRQVALLVQTVNSDVEAYTTVARRLELGREYNNSLNQRLQFGQNVSAVELIEASKTLVETEAAYLTYMMRIQMDLDRLQRMKFEGDYVKVD